MIKAVIFDIDGTLVDSVDLHAQAWKETFREYGKNIPYEQVRSQIGKGGDQLLPVFFSHEELDEFGEEMQAHRSKLFKREFLPRVKPFPEVRELFLRLKDDGKRLALGSSASDEELKAMKKIAGIEDLLEAETSAEDAEKSKPEPDIFQAALAKLGDDIAPSEVIVVGDTPYDVMAAAKAKLRTLGVLCGGFSEEDLDAAGCIGIYRDPADLLARYNETIIAQK
jgi:HAD superfamily hydrolase (TIGR01509 family)